MPKTNKNNLKTKVSGALKWAKSHPFSAVLSLLFIAALVWAVWSFLQWALIKAVWFGDSKEVARSGGATWAFIGNKILLFIFGFYPSDAWWRVISCLLLFVVYTIPFFIKAFKQKTLWLVILLVLAPLTVSFFISGGFILPSKPASDLGGLSLTLILSVLGLLLSFPVGLILALGRRSELPVIRRVSIAYIEFFRGIPLITILFLSSVAVPFFLPPGVTLDKMIRVVIGLVLFQSAYLAEVIRGGLQAIPKGQYEAADSLGFGYGLKNYLIIMPQVLRQCIANIGGISISFIKDTTLVLIIGMFDLLGIVNPLSNDPNWLGMEPEGLIFAGLVYWLICFCVSRVSAGLEKRMNTLPANAVNTAIASSEKGDNE